MAAIEASIPAAWEDARSRYVELLNAQNKARREYRLGVDEAYQSIADLRVLIADADRLREFESTLASLEGVVATEPPDRAMDIIKAARARARQRSRQPARSRRDCRRPAGPCAEARPSPRRRRASLPEARERYAEEVAWRTRAAQELLPGLAAYDEAIRHNIGLRVQERLTNAQARLVAECQSGHRDISLHF